MNSNEMTKRSLAMIDALQDEEACAALFTKAAEIVDEIATGWNRDTIRTEPVSKKIFEKFGQHYPA
jgi:hypothetical protein